MKGILSRARKRWRATWNKWSRFVEVGSRLGSYLRHRRRSMTVALALSLAFTATRLLEPWPMKLVIDWVLLGQPLPDSLASIPGVSQGSRMTLLYALAGAIIALAMLRGLVYLRHRLIVARLGIEVSAELRLDLYQHIQGLSLNFHDRRRTGDLIVRLPSPRARRKRPPDGGDDRGDARDGLEAGATRTRIVASGRPAGPPIPASDAAGDSQAA
jgi:hypothetical protein